MSIIDDIEVHQDFDPTGENGGYKFRKAVEQIDHGWNEDMDLSWLNDFVKAWTHMVPPKGTVYDASKDAMVPSGGSDCGVPTGQPPVAAARCSRCMDPSSENPCPKCQKEVAAFFKARRAGGGSLRNIVVRNATDPKNNGVKELVRVAGYREIELPKKIRMGLSLHYLWHIERRDGKHVIVFDE